MTEQPEYPPSTRGRVDTAVALARVEAKLDVAIAQHGAQLGELARGMVEVRGTLTNYGERIGGLEQHRAATDAREQSEASSRDRGLSRGQLAAVWVGLVVSALIGIVGILTTVHS